MYAIVECSGDELVVMLMASSGVSLFLSRYLGLSTQGLHLTSLKQLHFPLHRMFKTTPV